MPQRPLGPRLSLAADTSRGLPGVFTLEVGWVGQASEPHFERLVYQSSTSYQATVAGIAYSGHRKVAVGSDGGPRIGRARLVMVTMTRGGKGLGGERGTDPHTCAEP